MNYGTEPNPSGVKKLIQVSEELQKPVHVPVVLGNECFIVTQQDMRKIEDVRFISYNKLGPNGELIPIETAAGQEIALGDAILNAARFHTQNQGEVGCRQLLEVLGKLYGQQPQIKATIAQQMEWVNSCSSTSPAYPFTYSKSTSTNDMPLPQNLQPCCCTCPTKYVIHKGCNTMENDSTTDNPEDPPSARQMRKIRKMIEDTMGL